MVSKVSGWIVVPEIETLSDHCYLRYIVNCDRMVPLNKSPPVGWNWKKMDFDKFRALIWSSADCDLSIQNNSPDEYMEWIAAALRRAADCGAPRLKRPLGKRSAY